MVGWIKNRWMVGWMDGWIEKTHEQSDGQKNR